MNSDIAFIKKIASQENLASYDPYDVWVTSLGIRVKETYNLNKYIGLIPAAMLTIWDTFLNNSTRCFYAKREYPAVRAMATLALLESYKVAKDIALLQAAKNHIDWLIANTCKGYSGLCWGLGFTWAAGDNLDYDENTPFTTATPYALEAIDSYIHCSGDTSYLNAIERIYQFYEKDVQVMVSDADTMATSYGPSKDRVVNNAVAYTMYAYAIFSKYIPSEEKAIKIKIDKLYNFLVNSQLSNGSWFYEPDNPKSFIDCFHSCFVLKNIFKTAEIVPLTDSQSVVSRGYSYVKTNFLNPKKGLFKRFAVANKPSIVAYDLYDNAEVLQLSILLKDVALTESLSKAINHTFVHHGNIYSVVDLFGIKRNKNMYRWAVMPYIYALSLKKTS